jgi:hypothetical protein
MPIDFQAVCNSEKARDSLECLWYNDVLQEEAKDVLTLGWLGDGFANSGVDRVVEWNEMYFFLGDDGHVEEGPFKSLDDVLALPYLRRPMHSRPDLTSTFVPLDRLLEIGRDLVQSEGGVIDINNKQFVLSGGELVEKPPTRRHPEC